MLPTFKAIPQVMFCKAVRISAVFAFTFSTDKKWVPLSTDFIFGKR
jgi:hypothetical protein